MIRSNQLLLISLLVFLSACVSMQREDRPELTCAGPIGTATDRGALVERFGVNAVSDEEIDIGEGETVDGTAIYGSDDAKRIEVIWKDPSRKTRVSSVRVIEPSDWTVGGLSVGLDLAQVERLNGRSFSLYGFDWDYAGTVSSWNGGRFDSTGTCRVLARFRPSEESGDEDSLSGEKLYTSDDPRMRRLDATVYEVLLIFD